MTYDLVIIGNSAAAITAVNTIRKFDKSTSIALIDRENTLAYSRVLTPYYIKGSTDRKGIFMVDDSYYEKMNVTTYLGNSAEYIDKKSNHVLLSDNRKIKYKKLLLANGAEAIKIPYMSDRVLNLRHMSDAEKLKDHFSKGNTIAGYGAGLVTIPLLSHLDEKKEKILIISSNRIMSRVLDERASYILEEALYDCGVKIYKKSSIKDISENNGKVVINLESREIVADALIVGKGVKPNIELAKKSGIDVNYGVLIDEFCKTSDDDIYAAGDVAESIDFFTKERVVQGNWLTAVEQAEIAVKNALGLRVSYEGSVKCNITKVFGVGAAVVGYTGKDAYDNINVYDNISGIYRSIYIDKDGRIIGAVLLNQTDDTGAYYGLVKTMANIDNIINYIHSINFSKILKTLNYR